MRYLTLTAALRGPTAHLYYDLPPNIDARGYLGDGGGRVIYGPRLVPAEWEHLPLDTLRDIALGMKPKIPA